ncbi:DUF7507 domain-containing protein [Lysinibacter cavernae]|uniref:Putative repeat protein (TIGR01451 family) n=1 Tax=Lysinibacter cavernae TaxID=1640652 RepID=A0A7X5TS25_9MICO|nr:hypothetical protein [Lysinibacter cavernae]NIH52971.1 putative repeat protein (TIGR01451 family) [Lysinibacter cavernae]
MKTRFISLRRRAQHLRILAVALVATLLAGVFGLAVPAVATAAEPNIELAISAPTTVQLYAPFTYTVTASSAASPSDPIAQATASVVLPEGIAFDQVPTGAGSPVTSASWDETTRTVTFEMSGLTNPLVQFTFSVLQVDNQQKSPGDVLTAEIYGADSQQRNSVSTEVNAVVNYLPKKQASTLAGSDNRTVTYTFNVRTVDWSATTITATSWSQTLTDTLPAGSTVTGQSTALGSWKLTENGDGTTTAVWTRNAAYGPRSADLDAGNTQIWLQVYYPASEFADGTTPPQNTVSLEVTDRVGKVYQGGTASAQGPAFNDLLGGKGITVEKSIPSNGAHSAPVDSGSYLSTYLVKAGYTEGIEKARLDRMVVEDSAQQSAQNAEFFDHASLFRLTTQFSPALVALNAPVKLQYITNTNETWQDYSIPAMRTGRTTFSISVANDGSRGFIDGGPIGEVVIPTGQWMTGWRFIVDASATAGMPGGSEIRVTPAYMSSFASLSDPSLSATTIVNTAKADGVTTDGETVAGTSNPLTLTLRDRVNMITTVKAPTTITVGAATDYQVGVTNVNPAGVAYPGAVARVVLPVGVSYDPSVGVSALSASSVSGLPVPAIGDGATVTTETVTDAQGTHQVVVLTFDSVESVYAAGTAKERAVEADGYWYSIPTVTMPQALTSGGVAASVSSWLRDESPTYSGMPMAFWSGYFAPDAYFGSTIPQIATSSAPLTVTSAGGILLSKQVRTDQQPEWGITAAATSKGAVDWELFIANTLPNDMTDVVAFDRLPTPKDQRLSNFSVIGSGPITGLPAGAVAEYSTDAVNATSGTWTSNPVGATAVRVTIPTLAAGQSMTLVMPTTADDGLVFNERAANAFTLDGIYGGTPRSFLSNTAVAIGDGHPAYTLTKRTNGIAYTEAPGATVAVGSDVEWTYEITNTGDTPLRDLAVTDSYTAGDGTTGTLRPTTSATGPLLPGQSRTFTANDVASAGQYHNTAVAHAVASDFAGAPLGVQPEQQSDESWYLAGAAGLTVAKTTNGKTVPSAPGDFLVPGSAVTWEYTVSNTGTLPLTDILVSDVDSDGKTVFSKTVAHLAPGAAVTLSAPGTAITGQYHNTVTAAAAHPAGEGDLLAAASSWYFGAQSDLTVTKQVSTGPEGPWLDSTEVAKGDATYWRIVTTNTGNLPLSDVTVADEKLDKTIQIGEMNAGESNVVVLTNLVTDEDLLNEVAASATDVNGETVTGEDNALAVVSESLAPPAGGEPGSGVTPGTKPAGLAMTGSLGQGVLALVGGLGLLIGGFFVLRGYRGKLGRRVE